MTRIAIQPLTAANQADLNRCENSFTVEAELCLHAENGRISYTVRPVTPYVKHYGPEVYDAQAYTLAPELRCSAGVSRPEHAAWLAYVDSQLAGQILVHENPGLSQDEGWNRFAIIWDIAVDPPFRRQGIGQRLIEQAVAWARSRGLPGIMLETQNINVPACRLYASRSFVLGGFDACLYRGVMPGTHESALFWYLLF